MKKTYEGFYVKRAQRVMGTMMEFAYLNLHMDPDKFFDLFIYSGISEEFQKGNPKYIAGMSGKELALEVIRQTSDRDVEMIDESFSQRSELYWAGWVIAYYQWYSNNSFNRIHKMLPFEKLIGLYNPLFQADIKKIVIDIDEFIDGYVEETTLRNQDGLTNLANLRKYYKLSQRALAEKAGVKLRMVQLYEQRQNDINKGQVMTLKKLSEALNCRIEDLLED